MATVKLVAPPKAGEDTEMTVLDTQLYIGDKVASNYPHTYQGQHPGSGLVLTELREVNSWGTGGGTSG